MNPPCVDCGAASPAQLYSGRCWSCATIDTNTRIANALSDIEFHMRRARPRLTQTWLRVTMSRALASLAERIANPRQAVRS